MCGAGCAKYERERSLSFTATFLQNKNTLECWTRCGVQFASRVPAIYSIGGDGGDGGCCCYWRCRLKWNCSFAKLINFEITCSTVREEWLAHKFRLPLTTKIGFIYSETTRVHIHFDPFAHLIVTYFRIFVYPRSEAIDAAVAMVTFNEFFEHS